MKFCETHWADLRQQIQDVGLSTLVAESGEEAIAKIGGSLQDGVTMDNFDPLMQSHNAIVANALHLCSQNEGDSALELMGMFGTDWCPLCYLNAQHEQMCETPDCTFSYDNWTKYAAQDQLAAWKALKV